MFSRLDPYFKTTFRQAESTDTRQAIQREEKQEGRKKKDENHHKPLDNSLWEDSAGVSVEALRAFLMNFLKDLPAEDNESSQNFSPLPPQETDRKPQNTKTARALQAYETMSYHAHPEDMTYSAGSTAADANLVLKSYEVRTMHQLIDQLGALSKRGIHSLTIIRANSFLESIALAIKAVE